MFTHLGALAGAFGGGLLRLLPELISAWRSREHHRDALELAKVYQGETDVQAQVRLEAARTEAMLIEQSAQGERTGVRPIDTLTLSVRPIVTFWLLFFYTLYKAVVIYDALRQGISISSLAPILRTDDDVEIFSGAITFWFLDQTLNRRNYSARPYRYPE
jgi:hypothetical protein